MLPQVCAVPSGGRDKEELSGEGGLNNECGQQKTNHSMPQSQVNVSHVTCYCLCPFTVCTYASLVTAFFFAVGQAPSEKVRRSLIQRELTEGQRSAYI